MTQRDIHVNTPFLRVLVIDMQNMKKLFHARILSIILYVQLMSWRPFVQSTEALVLCQPNILFDNLACVLWNNVIFVCENAPYIFMSVFQKGTYIQRNKAHATSKYGVFIQGTTFALSRKNTVIFSLQSNDPALEQSL